MGRVNSLINKESVHSFVEPKAKKVEEYAKQFPLRKLASPEQVVETYIYLISNSYTTGTSMVTDGGAKLI